MRHLPSLLRGVVVLAIVLGGSTVRAQSIGIHFVNDSNGGGPGLTPSPLMGPAETAGVVAQANWNNAVGSSGFAQGPLTDQNGTPLLGTLVWWEGAGTGTTQVPDAQGDSRLMGSFLDSNDRSLTFVLLTGLSALTSGTYDVYVYSNGDGHGGRHGFFSVGFGGSTLECTDLGVFDGTDYVEDLQDGHGGNFVHFKGIKGDALLLLATAQNPKDPSDNGQKAPINGIEIVVNKPQ